MKRFRNIERVTHFAKKVFGSIRRIEEKGLLKIQREVSYRWNRWQYMLKHYLILHSFINTYCQSVREEVTGEWTKLHNEELNDLFSSPNIVRMIKSRRMRWAGHVVLYRVLVGKPEGKRLLGRPRRRWEDNSKTCRQDVGCECMDWIDVPQERERWRALVNAVMNFRVL
jgi:succinate dehydrogenase flavin-adding protein (antitoxin of CptAB toxin-antitoxin module)